MSFAFFHSSRRLASVLITCLSLLTGCTVGPNFHRPILSSAAGYTAGSVPVLDAGAASSQKLNKGAAVPDDWWQLFHSQKLNDLVAEALSANPDLQSMQSALKQAQENTRVAQAAFLPTAQLAFSPSRQRVANGISSTLNSGSTLFNLHTAGVAVGYSLDVFGLNRRQYESQQAEEEVQRDLFQAARITLVTTLVTAVVQSAALQDQIRETRALLQLDQQQLDLMNRQVKLGSLPELTAINQQTIVEQTRLALVGAQKQLQQQNDQINALLGDFPNKKIVLPTSLTDLSLPQDLPLSLPSVLVRQRPDILAAEAMLHVASAQVGVAVASRLPQLMITADAGQMSSVLGNLFNSASTFWALAGGVVQPVFDGGALLHRQRAAEAGFAQSKAQYRAAVLNAFANVADTLHALDYDAQAVTSQDHIVQTAKISLDSARRQVVLGDISPYDVLAVEQVYRQSLLGLIQVKANRFADSAALFQALGGGWRNRAHTAT
jgi:NodT family efflux transporter outer membrane factor (OMF) lipoprotein